MTIRERSEANKMVGATVSETERVGSPAVVSSKSEPTTGAAQESVACERCGRCREGDFANCKNARPLVEASKGALPFVAYAYSKGIDGAESAGRAIESALAAPVAAAPVEMSPEFTDTARAAIAWVLWHHQGGSSPVGQPLRFALGMGAHDRLPDWRIAEAKRYAELAGATTADFHKGRASTPAAPVVSVDSDAFDDLVDEVAAEHGEMLDDGGPSGWSFTCEDLVAFAKHLMSGYKGMLVADAYAIARAEAKRDSTPAAPGIDLTPIKLLVLAWRHMEGGNGSMASQNRKDAFRRCANELEKALKLIDASPKGGSGAESRFAFCVQHSTFPVLTEDGRHWIMFVVTDPAHPNIRVAHPGATPEAAIDAAMQAVSPQEGQ